MAFTKQISVFLSNKSGRIADVTEILAKNDIDLRALCIADGENYGALRIITNEQDKALAILKAANFTCKITDVLAVEIPNVPGSLAKILSALQDNGIGIDYIYAYVGIDATKARVIIRVSDNELAEKTLLGIGVSLIEGNK